MCKWSRAGRVLAAMATMLALSGCVVVPAYYPRHAYYHPYRYYYYP